MIDVEILSNDFIKVSSEVVADSVKYQKVKFSFPEHWTGALKTAVFSNGDIVKNVILNSDSPMYVSDDIYYIPHEVIKAPGFTISVFGILNDTVLTSDNGVVRVRESGMLEGEVPSKPTPSEYQQLIELAKKAESIAQSVRDDADNGKFKGDKGDPAITDQTFSPTSENAQSGKAVAEAVAQSGGGTVDDWEQLIDVTTQEDASSFSFTFKDVKELIVMISGIASHARVNFYSDGMTNFYHYQFLKADKFSSNYMYIRRRLGGMRYVESGQFSSCQPDLISYYELIGSTSFGILVSSKNDMVNNLKFDFNSPYILTSGARIQIFGR